MRRVVALFAMFALSLPALESVPTEAWIGIDRPSFNEEGEHAGWHMVFSAHIYSASVDYWIKDGENTNYVIAEEKLSVVKREITKLSKEIRNNENKSAGHLYRIQFGFRNKAGQVSGLFMYNDVNGLPPNVSDIVSAIKLLTGNT